MIWNGTAIKKSDVIGRLGDILYKPYLIEPARHNLLKNNSRNVDIVTGNSKRLTLGFKEGNNPYPITLLKLKVEEVASKKHDVIFTLRKKQKNLQYEEILYWKNNISKKRLRKIERQYGTKINYSKAFENWENR